MDLSGKFAILIRKNGERHSGSLNKDRKGTYIKSSKGKIYVQIGDELRIDGKSYLIE